MPFYLENIDLFGKKVTFADPFGHIKSGSAEKAQRKAAAFHAGSACNNFLIFMLAKSGGFV